MDLVTLQTPKRTSVARCGHCGHFAALHEPLGRYASSYDDDGKPVYTEVRWIGCDAKDCKCEATREWAYKWAV